MSPVAGTGMDVQENTGIRPVLLLLGVYHCRFGDLEPMASSVLPHAVDTVGYKITILHPTCHGHTEMKLHMIV